MRRGIWLVGGLAALAALIDCTDILGLAPTDPVPVPPAIDSNCATKITALSDSEEGAPLQIAADANGVFWIAQTAADSGYVRGLVSGSIVDIAPTALVDTKVLPVSIALDAKYVYWNAWDTYSAKTNRPTIYAWDRSTQRLAAVVPLTINAGELALDKNALYFGEWQQTNDAGVWALPLPLGDASAPQPVVSGLDSPFHVATDSQNVYFDQGTPTGVVQDNTVGKSVFAVPLDGGVIATIGTSDVVDLVVSGGTIYWASKGQGAGTGTGRVNSVGVDGGGATNALVNNPSKIAVSSGWIYAVSDEVEPGRDAIVRTQAGSAAPPQTCATGLVVGGPIFALGNDLYFSAKASNGFAVYDLQTNP